ncbi:MAG: hypothetical protein PHV39_06995 [Methanomicrobium sp.]|nr:hypothetical protein [Methanomicrobium sp.]
MLDILLGTGVVIAFFFIGAFLGYFIMNIYFKKRFTAAAEKCRDDDSFEPFIVEMEEVS